MPGRARKSREEKDSAEDVISSQESQLQPVTNDQVDPPTDPTDPSTDSNPTTAATTASTTKSDFTKALSEALLDKDVQKGFENILMPMVTGYVKNYVGETLRPFQNKLEDLDMEMVVLKSNMDDHKHFCDTTVSSLTQRVRDLERQARARNFRITGLRPAETGDSETTMNSRYSTSLLRIFDEAGIKDIAPTDFVEFVNIKLPAVSGSFTTVIVKCTTEKVRDMIYSQRLKLKNCTGKHFINEDLTKHDAAVFKRTRSEVKAGTLNSCWTKGGMVWAKASAEGKPFHIPE